MIELITRTVYRVVSRALFARHQILFSFYLCMMIHSHKSTVGKSFVDEVDWQCLLHGSNTTLFAGSVDGGTSPRKGMKKSL